MSDVDLNLSSLTTEELILRLKEVGAERSLYCQEIILRFEPLLRRAWQREASSEYQDFVQDVFVRLFAGLPQLRDPKAFPGYFRSVAHSVASHRWKKANARPTRSEEEVERLVKGTDESLITRIFIRSYLERLPTREREVITLAFLEDLSPKDIAALLGVEEGAIRATKSRALKRLRAFFLKDARTLERNLKRI
jgi:RNA polymerase sigma-70 factor (ECF subfamily)